MFEQRVTGAGANTGTEQIVRYLLHAILLCLLTATLLWAVYRWPRSYPSASLREGNGEAIARLYAHPGAQARDWRHIIVHHSATVGGSAASFERYHVHVRRWSSLGYHFVIGNGTQTGDGVIEVGGRWTGQEAGSHASGYNEDGIGICLVGNFDTQRPTPAQLRSLRTLVLHLARTYDIPPENVIGHRECKEAQTACPGANLDLPALRRWLSRRLSRGAEDGRR